MTHAPATPLPDARPDTAALFALPAAAAEARSKYLAQGFLLFVGLIFLIGTFLIARWSSYSLDQQTRFWDSRLSQGAFNAAAHADAQLSARQEAWGRLARSDAIKLYAMQALSGEGDRAQASRDYLENALRLTLEREGIDGAPATNAVPVNRANQGQRRPGVVLTEAGGTPLISLGGAKPVPASIRAVTVAGEAVRIYGPYLEAGSDSAWLTIVAPISAVQSSEVVAQLHATYPLSALNMFPPGTDPAIETVLINPQSDLVLSVGAGGADLTHAPAFGGDERYRWAGARGRGTASATTISGAKTLLAAQPVGSTQWIAVQSVKTADALAAVRRQTWIWLLGSILALGLACGLILLSWRRGVAQRAAAIAAARDSAGQSLAEANALLTSMADSQPSAVLVVGGDDHIAFANRAASYLLGVDDERDGVGLTLARALPDDAALPMQRAIDSARAIGRDITAATEIEINGALRHGRLTAIPLSGFEDGNTILLAFDDVTEIVSLRARREEALRHLVSVLTGLIDARDPHSASHSRKVARLSVHIARTLNYGTDMQRDVEMSALLSNAGKILVPRDLLTKPGALTQDELARVRSAIHKTGALLESVEFDGRVRQILNALESAEEGQDIDRQAAQIVAGANALVGMISPRAHRDAMSVDSALEALSAAVPDKQVLAAIDHAVRNQAAIDKIQRL